MISKDVELNEFILRFVLNDTIEAKELRVSSHGNTMKKKKSRLTQLFSQTSIILLFIQVSHVKLTYQFFFFFFLPHFFIRFLYSSLINLFLCKTFLCSIYIYNCYFGHFSFTLNC